GTFTTTLGATWASSSPSFTMASKSVATTSRLTSPGTIEQISSTSGRNGRFSLAASDGLVVTPSTTPSAMPSRISFTFAVSRKIFIGSSLGCLSARLSLSARLYRNAGTRADTLQRPGVADDVPDDVDGAGRPDLVAAAHGGGSEEDGEGRAGRPVAEVPQLHDLARRLRGEGQADVEVDLVAPRLAARLDRQRRRDGDRRPRVVQLGRDGDTTRSDLDRPGHRASAARPAGRNGRLPGTYASARSSAVRRATRPALTSRPRCTRIARRPRSPSTWRSPRAWAAFTTPKLYFCVGTSTSSVSSAVTMRNTPVFGPPLEPRPRGWRG